MVSAVSNFPASLLSLRRCDKFWGTSQSCGMPSTPLMLCGPVGAVSVVLIILSVNVFVYRFVYGVVIVACLGATNHGTNIQYLNTFVKCFDKYFYFLS